MKKLIAFVLIIITLAIAFASCAGENTPEATTYNYYTSKITPTAATTATGSITPTEGTIYVNEPTESTTEATTSSTTNVDPYVKTSFIIAEGKAAKRRYLEMPSKILILRGAGKVSYISRADGEIYEFCFNPLCQHPNPWDSDVKCVAEMARNYQMCRTALRAEPVFCNSRLYFMYFNELYSCSEFASDLRKECSFGSIAGLTYQQASNRTYFNSIMTDGETSVFFLVVDENGKLIQYRYDVVKRKLINLTEKMEAASKKNGGLLLYFVNREYATLITSEGKSVSVKCFENGKALCYGYSSATKMNESGWGDGIPEEGELEGYYYVDYDFENYEKVDATDVKSQDFSFVMNDGFLKSVAVRDENNNYIGRQYILADNDGNEKLYFDFTADTGDLYGGVSYIDENYFYFQKTGAENQVKVGVSKTYLGNSGDVFNMNGGKLYRYNRKTGEIECIIDDPNYQIGAILYASEETGRFVCYCTVFTKESDGTVSSHSDVLCCGELKNGVLSDFKPYVELYNPGSSDFPF